MTTPPEWVECLAAVEQDLRKRADWRVGRPALLMVDADDAADVDGWRWVVNTLIDKGWRLGVEDPGSPLWFFAPGPLSPPDPEQAGWN
jgi:hypothetical protein